MTNFTFIDLYSGIGGFRLALEKFGGNCLNFSEIDNTAIKTYCNNFQESVTQNLGDITKLKSLQKHNILTAGVPCQSWSIAGKKKGFNDSRGLLWNNTIDLLNESRPDVFIFENVKGLTDNRNKKEFTYIINRINESGYYVDYFVLNSFDYGVPQNRERVYIVGFKNKEYFDKFVRPTPIDNKVKLNSIINKQLNNSYSNKVVTLSDIRGGDSTIHSWDLINTSDRQKHICNLLLKNRRKKIFGKSDGNPLSLSDFKTLDQTIDELELVELVELNIFKRINGKFDFKFSKASLGINGVHRIYQPLCESFSTLVASGGCDFITEELIVDDENFNLEFINKVILQGRYRKLTKSEMCQVQGFPSNYKLPDETKKWEKLLGNSVSVPVIEHITKSIINTQIFK